MIRRDSIGDHHFMLMDSSDILQASRDGRKWMNHQNGLWRYSIDKFEQQAVTGESSYVEESEKFLADIEDQIPMSRGWRNVDDVVGAVPNVPAFLAGHPQCMRRRMRVSRDNAPLTVYMDLVSSSGISEKNVLRRGIVLMTLVRMLVEHRPVELWIGTTLQDGHTSGTAAWRIDTAPLDLARAAFHIADPKMSRLFGYAMCETLTNCHLGGTVYRNDEKEQRLRQVAGWYDTLYVPAIGMYDPMVDNPVGWLRGVMAKYVGENE